ncbi:MAG TPA: MFS transporter [Thermomicrobiales bacterium]|nr:MFS transporter [Thermomicrobiales bacterium]
MAAFAHFSHDLYPSFIGPLVPAIQDKLNISLAMASLMIPAQQMPSILQPFIGLLADRTSRRWFVVISPATAAISLSSLGLAPNIAVVLLLLLVSGLSSATFHAPTVALVGEYGGNKMGRAMAIFMAGGEVARTIGPILITGAIALLTLEGSFVVMIVGIVASVVLYLTLDTTVTDARRQAGAKVDFKPLLRARRGPISGLLGYSILTGVATTPFHYFLVKLLVEKGHGEWYGGFALSTLFAAGVVGGLVGGSLSDRVGRRAMLVGFTAATPPLLYLYLWAENGTWWVLGLLAVAGAITMAPRSVTLAVGAELLPEARGPMAGLLLALGFVSQSLAALAFGAFADQQGIIDAYWFIPAIWFLSLPFILLLPRRGAPLAMPA